ncbi:hypothetical protein [Amycolatopsis jiangsuensis]|uniref:ACT domain-containing protein n=1 Tax=Amycolatopsis jiangsuensis TaxID=1181879 RepID=A0A840J121_9PSEU|nr:hypothetical protein [Amycolatopsis jiangsuensis]MBB4688686.1 hypothetical protein [Amycolatopsis jiangsuensis]
MSAAPSFPATRPAFLPRRRIATYFTGGIEEIPALVGALAETGRHVHDLSVDVRDGVSESSMACAVLVSAEEMDALLDRLRELPAVVSAEPV